MALVLSQLLLMVWLCGSFAGMMAWLSGSELYVAPLLNSVTDAEPSLRCVNVQNLTSESIKVVNFDPGCSCAAAERLPLVLPPYSSGSFYVALSPGYGKDSLSATLVFERSTGVRRTVGSMKSRFRVVRVRSPLLGEVRNGTL
jgi:hypothetical protein